MDKNLSNTKIVIGLGAGRCGTTSLAKLLDSQADSKVTHQRQRLTWATSAAQAAALLASIAAEPVAMSGDVAFYWLPYVEMIKNHFPQTKLLCLYRPQEEYVESWNNSQPIIRPVETDPLFKAYPQLNISDPYEYARSYHKMYYDEVERLKIKMFPVEHLNTDQQAIFDYLEIDNPNYLPVRENTR